MFPLKKGALICIVLLTLFACRKSTNANWDVDVSLPVVNSVLNIKNFVSDTLFDSDNTGLVHFILNQQVAALKLDSILTLPDTLIKIPFINTSFFPLNFQVGEAINAFPPAELQFNISNGVAIKKVNIKQGTMTVKFSNFLTEPVDLVYKITSAVKNGEQLTVSETVPTGTNSLVRTYDLSGYSLNMRGISGQVYNTIVQTYTFALSTTASNSLTVNPGDGAQVEVTYSDIIPEYLEGYFGQQSIDIKQDTARLGFSDNFKASNFMLSDATMDFTILNDIGAEFSASLPNNTSINSVNQKVVPLINNQLSNININRATKTGSEIYPSKKLISFTPANSNITSFISNLPDKLSYTGNIQLNPLGNISGYNDFAFYNTGIRIMANIRIPIKFTADFFELRSNADVDFSEVRQLNNVNYGHFLIVASNGFPFDVKLQGYLYDEQKILIDSLFVPGSDVISGGAVDINNNVTAATEKKLTIPFSEKKIEHLKKCKNIRIVSRFIMPPNPADINIREHYELKLNVIANMNYNVSLSGN